MIQTEKLEKLVDYAIEHEFVSENFAWISEDRQALLDYWFTADNYKAVIFNHNFARALFGSEMVQYTEVDDDGNTWHFSALAYQYHPMQAVISDDPIGYMYGVVFGE